MKNQFSYFNQCKNLNDVKLQFRILAKKHHPDLGGNAEIFKIINNEYEFAFEYFQKLDNLQEEKTAKTENRQAKYNKENATIYKNIIEKLVRMENVNIEIVGSWIWLDGNTYTYKEMIKEIGFRWSKSKKKWYYFENIQKTNKQRGYYSYNKIVEKYGSIKIENENNPKLS